jgi:hypothetical protein
MSIFAIVIQREYPFVVWLVFTSRWIPKYYKYEYVSVFLPYFSSVQSACAVLYCYQRPVWLYHIFPHFLVNGTMFGKICFTHKMCAMLFCTVLSETFLILKEMGEILSRICIGRHVKYPQFL